MITLFSERPELNQRPYSFVASILVHCAVVGLVAMGLIYAPKVKTPARAEQYAVRHLDLHTLEAQMQRARREIEYPRPHSVKHSLPSGGSTAEQQPVMRQVVLAPKGPQTLLQPDIPKPVVLAVEIPVPTVVIWDGKKSPAKTLVPPLPVKPAVADVKPSTQLPNEDQNLADIAIAPTDLPVPPQPILPSTTSPVVVSGPKPTPPAPVTTAQGSAQPTPTAVMSLSDSRMADGAVTLPPVNESASSNSPGALTPGQGKDSGQAGKVNPAGKAGGAGAGQNSRDDGDPTDPAATAQGTKSAPGRSAPGQSSPGQSASGQSAFGQGNKPSTAHIELSITGHFGAVVVGSSLEEEYPEAAQQWSGRLAYTVYLHVGLAKSWILQYSLPRAGDAAAAGNITRIEAPWAYNIVRPNIDPGTVDADALMVRGFVNQAGRFEALAIVFPPQFAEAQFVLSSLAQWQWRPATQNGQNVKVEVLLIIPEEQE
jgi:hypothetical protein